MPEYLPLTRGETALVDASDYESLAQWKWLYVGSGYAGRFVTTDGKKSLVYLHRYLLNPAPDQRVDHSNGDRLDNRRENLRLVTVRQNRRRSSRSRSGYEGVSWHKAARKWDARITLKGVRVHLGYSDDAERAALVYGAAARELFGEYAIYEQSRARSLWPHAVTSVQRAEPLATSTSPLARYLASQEVSTAGQNKGHSHRQPCFHRHENSVQARR